VLDKYPTQVKIVYKHFPLQAHRLSPTASLAAAAAQDQGKFWQYHDLIFDNFRTLTPQKFKEFAEQLHLDMPRFESYMNSQAAKDKVIQDMTIGREIGVVGTPTIYINGRQLRERTIEGISKLVDPIIKKGAKP